MSQPYVDLSAVNKDYVKSLNKDELAELSRQVIDLARFDRKENQLLYYRPASERAEKVHHSRSRITGVFGGNRSCIPLDEPVLMADGTWRALEDVRPGDRVIACDPETGSAVASSVVNVFRSGAQDVYRVDFSDGGSFRATAEHRVPLYLGSGRQTSKGKPKKPKKRRLGDYLEAISIRGAKNPSKRIAAVSPRDIQYEGDCKLRIHPYLLGALLGDGSFSSRPSVKFHNVDEAVIERVRGHVEGLGLELRKYKHGCEFGVTGPKGHPNLIREEADRLGLWVRDRHKKIPLECFWLSRYGRSELLAGLIDTDGTRDWFTSASKDLAMGVAKLVRSLGGKATMHRRETPSPHGVAWSVYIRLNDRLPLSMERKQAQNSKREVDYRRRVCRAVEYDGQAECGDLEVEHPSHCYVVGDYAVVSNSKSETALVEMIIHATGVIPYSLRDVGIDWSKKLRGPISCRVEIESFASNFHESILSKFIWSRRTGLPEKEGEKGHWGWIPRSCLIDGEWEKSWSEKNRILRVLYKNPDNYDEVLGESTIQFMSHDQEASKLASGEVHFYVMDEPPPYSHWREALVRISSVNGRLMLAMTWPDDPAINVDWIFDEVWEPGQEGPQKNPNIDLHRLVATENRMISQEGLRETYIGRSDAFISVRVEGKPIRFSNRIHPLFSDVEVYYCFQCGEERSTNEDGTCVKCGTTRGTNYCHVREFEHNPGWPVVWIVDPHPRKPHMSMYVAVSPQDHIFQVAELECDGDPTELRIECEKLESQMRMHVAMRLIDPKMAGNPSGVHRDRTWLDEFHDAGLYVDPADSSDVGRERFNTLLQPDEDLGFSPVTIHPRCGNTILQLKRFMWDDWRESMDKDIKQKPKQKYDDYPACWRYFCNSDPRFQFLVRGARVVRTQRGRRY